MFDDRVVPRDERRQCVLLPDQVALVAFLRLLQDKTQSGIVALIFDTVESAPPALEAHPFGLAHADAVEGTVGTRGQGLSEHRVDMLGNPGGAQPFSHLMQGSFREAVLLAQAQKSRVAFLLAGTGDGPRGLPARIGPHLPQASLSFGEHRIVELTPCFQMRTQAFGLVYLNSQGELEQKRGRFLCEVFTLLGLLCALQLHAFSPTRTAIPSISGRTPSVKQRSALPSPAPTRNGASSPG